MDQARAAKRRKIEASPGSTLDDAQELQCQQEKLSSSNRKTTSAKAEHTSASSAQAAWRRAKRQSSSYKAKRQSGTSREQEQGVPNDGKDAHGQNTTDLVTGSVGKLKPAAKSLDPLRNQRYDSSPAKVQSTPTKGAGALGFFKQFHAPRKEVNHSPSQADEGEGESRSIAVAGAVDDRQDHNSADEQANGVALRARGRPKRTQAPSVADLTISEQHPPRKTFEQEIKELEDKAREEAEAEAEAEAGAEDEEIIIPIQRSVRRAKENHKVLGKNGLLGKSPAQHRDQPAASPLGRHRTQPVNVSPEASSFAKSDKSYGSSESAQKGASPTREADIIPLTPSKPVTTFHRPETVSLTNERILAADITLENESLKILQRIVLQKANGQRRIPITNLSDSFAKVSALIEQTISAGESNSMLLIGARGSGKSALVRAVLEQEAAKHADDFYVVRLNGFIHTDDKLALREIWRQLGRDMGLLEEHESSARNYADTLATLLALLSHPAETGQEQLEGHVYKSVVFILDDFDLFAHHPRQTLLYNLFDVAQSRKAPIAVLGLTTRIDVTETLEKRVKSRFSHRYVHLGLAKSFSAFCDIVRAALSIKEQELSSDERAALSIQNSFDTKLAKASMSMESDSLNSCECWNAVVDALISTDGFESHLRRIYYTTKSIPDVLSTLLIPFATLPTNGSTSSDAIISHITSSLAMNQVKPPDSKLALLSSLSTLQLALLICAARLTAIHNADMVSFLLAYEEYKVLASKAKLQATASGMAGTGGAARVWGKEVARGAWGDMMEMGLIIEDGRSGASSGRVDVGLEEIGVVGSGGSVDLGGWGRWCNEI